MPEVDALATIRPDDWNLALFLHVLGAMVAVGGLALALACLAGAWRGGSATTLRAGFRALLYGAIPGYIVMRGAAQWIYAKEHLDDLPEDPDWIAIGFAVADVGLVALLFATIMSGAAARKARRLGGGERTASGEGAVKVTSVVVALLLIAYVVTIWAMTAKP